MNPSSQPPTTPGTKRRFRLPPTVLMGLTLFGLAGSCLAFIIPGYFHKGDIEAGQMPPIQIFFLAGLVMIILTALLFAFFKRLGLGWGRSALVLALGYNVTIAIIKFCLAPMAMYKVGSQTVINAGSGDPNTSTYYVLAGIIIFFLYILAFGLLYKHYKKRVVVAIQKPRSRRTEVTLGIIALVLLLVLIGGGGALLLLVPLFFIGPALQYLGIISIMGLPIGLGIVAAIFMAQRGFKNVSAQAVAMRNPALLASFFWTGLTLIALYHALWVIFMIALVQLWPFNTYTPK